RHPQGASPGSRPRRTGLSPLLGVLGGTGEACGRRRRHPGDRERRESRRRVETGGATPLRTRSGDRRATPLRAPPGPEHSDGRGAMTIAMSEHVDAEPCDVLRGGDGPVYFLLGGRLYVVHEILGRWIEPDSEPRRLSARRVPAARDTASRPRAQG